jgi:hypothetical protein
MKLGHVKQAATLERRQWLSVLTALYDARRYNEQNDRIATAADQSDLIAALDRALGSEFRVYLERLTV